MYKFIFYFIYKGQMKENSGVTVSRYLGALLVSLAIFFHLMFIYSLSKLLLFYFLDKDISFSTGKQSGGKLLFAFLCLIPIIICVFRYFKVERIEKIANYYDEHDNFYSLGNFIKFFSIYLFPLIISILMIRQVSR